MFGLFWDLHGRNSPSDPGAILDSVFGTEHGAIAVVPSKTVLLDGVSKVVHLCTAAARITTAFRHSGDGSKTYLCVCFI